MKLRLLQETGACIDHLTTLQMMKNDTPDNGDFAAYLKNLDNPGKTKVPSDPVTSGTLPVSQNSSVVAIEAIEESTDQELAELPPISDDDLLQQALAVEGNSNEYDLDDSLENLSNDDGVTAKAGPPDEAETAQAALGFLGEHALKLADQPTPEELNEMPPITDEELIQQALAHPENSEDRSSE
ncbi:hypothetical protein ACO0LM_16415 [Undibacterium sp. Di26W]|uniref:hypothetical protein n=1 Tax=Undibacterium sp. Di26W TaxID=3413035 RepID=UPI003BEFFB29